MHSERSIHGYLGSYTLRTDVTPRAAAVFVHGFGGDAFTTFQHLQQLVPVMSELADVDLFFYAYPSTKYPIVVAAEKLSAFISAAVLEGSRSRTYRSVLLVGHSLGAVLVRQVIADAAGKTQTQRSNASKDRLLLGTSPVLFAPAHAGFRHEKVVASAATLSRGLWLATVLWQYFRSRAYGDLAPDSPVLAALRDKTTSLASSEPLKLGLRAGVVWGSDENVVFMTEYIHDHRLEVIENKNHVTVCKPVRSEDYLAPITFITNGLQNQRV